MTDDQGREYRRYECRCCDTATYVPRGQEPDRVWCGCTDQLARMEPVYVGPDAVVVL